MLLYDLENLLGEVQYGEIPDLQIDLDYTVRPFTEVEDEYLMLFAKYSGTAASKAVYLEDIAHALSLVCRGGGQIRWFYSVGQHSINCAHEALARGWSDRMALACLLHDASECYISDVIRPVKVHLQNYLEIESMIMDAIWEKFHLDDLTDEENQKWKQIDNEILELELKTLMKGEKDREIIPLSSTPDLSERTFSSVEKEFKELALELFQKLS